MTGESRPRKNPFSYIEPFAGIGLLMVFVMVINALVASRTSQTTSQPQLPSSQPTPPALALSETDPTNGWLVYKSEAYGFTLKYPARLKVEELPSLKSFAVKFYSPEAVPEAIMPEEPEAQKQFEEQYLFVYLQVHDNSLNLTLREVVQRIYSQQNVNTQQTAFELMEPNLQPYGGGPQGSLVFVGSVGENPQKDIFFSHNGKVFTITLYGSGGTGGGYSATAEKVFELMVSTIDLR